jgi:hypothetical protein
MAKVPEKPKGMWTRTYGCLLDEILGAEILAHEAQSNMLATAMTSLLRLTLGTSGPSRKRDARSSKPRKPDR